MFGVIVLSLGVVVKAARRFTPSAGRKRALERQERMWADNVNYGEPTYPSGLDFVID
jgi:hypothetical protein